MMKKASELSDELKRRLAQKLIEDERRRAREGGLTPSEKGDPDQGRKGTRKKPGQ